MPPSSVAELSLRHLPELSDASISFQIPVAVSSDLLLGGGDDDDDFFQGVDPSLNTPGSSRIAYEPLTLSQLTPKPKASHAPSPDTRSSAPFPSLTFDPPSELILKPASTKIAKSTGTRAPHKNNPIQKGGSSSTVAQPVSGEGLSAKGWYENLKAEVQTLVGNFKEDDKANVPIKLNVHCGHSTAPSGDNKPRSQQREVKKGRNGAKPISKPKRIVVAGGISKPRKEKENLSNSAVTHPFASSSRVGLQLPRVTELIAGRELKTNFDPQFEDQTNPDISVCSSINGAVADRLVMYSQKFANSFGLFNSETSPEPRRRETRSPDFSRSPNLNPSSPGTHKGYTSDHDQPLTLSQISPRKATLPAVAFSAPAPPSPMHPSSKRPVSVESQPQRKRGKTAPAVPPATVTTVLQPSIRKNLSAITSNSGLSSRKAKIQTAKVTHALPRPEKGKAPKLLGEAPVRSSSSTASIPSELAKQTTSGDTETQPKQRRDDSTSMAIGRMPHFAKPVTTLPPANPTKPIGFNFQLDTRMEARKAELEKEKSSLQRQNKRQNPIPVPDFKALHAAQEAELAFRKEQITPIVPHAIELNTDGRARERSKFDEMIKEKEREIERVIEERKREREAEEEKEVRELRKRAIPRAHEVPGWYKEAPKRKEKDGDSIRG